MVPRERTFFLKPTAVLHACWGYVIPEHNVQAETLFFYCADTQISQYSKTYDAGRRR